MMPQPPFSIIANYARWTDEKRCRALTARQHFFWIHFNVNQSLKFWSGDIQTAFDAAQLTNINTLPVRHQKIRNSAQSRGVDSLHTPPTPKYDLKQT